MRHPFDTMTRRGGFRNAAMGSGAAAPSMAGWLGALAAGTPRRPLKSVVVLWLNGGPATIDMWDLKPGHANGGPFKEIATAAPGLTICEHLPRLARHGQDLALVRSMSTREGDHDRASFLLRTGYAPAGAIRFPSVGAVVAKEIGPESSDLPNFVSITPARYVAALGGGFLGPRYDPLILGDGASPADGLKVPDLARGAGVSESAQQSRLDILRGIEERFDADHPAPVADGIRAASARAARLMRPEAAAAFNLDEEPGTIRDAYGRGLFGQGCCWRAGWSNAAFRSSRLRSTDGTRIKTTSSGSRTSAGRSTTRSLPCWPT